MSPKCWSDIKVIHAFLQAAEDSWRRSLYIECAVCRYSKTDGCGDFLFVPEVSGRPVLLPLKDAEFLFGSIDKSECLGQISNVKFQELYKSWLEKRSNSECPFLGCCRHYFSARC